MRLLVTPAALLLAAASVSGQTLVLDTFSDTDRIGGLNGSATNSTTPIGTPTATNTQWISNRPSQLVASATGMLWTMDSSSRLITGYFPTVSLVAGETTTFSLKFTTGASGLFESNLRLALVNGAPAGIRLTEQPNSTDATYVGDTGYGFFSGSNTGGGNTSNLSMNLRERTNLSNNILGTLNQWDPQLATTVGSPATGYFAANTDYTLSWSFSLAADSSAVEMTAGFSGGNFSSYSLSATDSASLVTSFDQIHFRLGAGADQFASINFTEFSVVQGAPIPEPGTYAAFAGLAALGLVVLRRRRAR